MKFNKLLLNFKNNYIKSKLKQIFAYFIKILFKHELFPYFFTLIMKF